MASCSKCNHRAAWRFEEQLLSCQPDATPASDGFYASSSVGTAAVNCRERPRLAGSGALLECLRHTTRDEDQLLARQTSSQGVGPTRQRLEDRAHAAAGRTLFAD